MAQEALPAASPSGDPYAEPPDPYAEPPDPYAEPSGSGQVGCVFMLDEVDPALLTVQERIARMEQALEGSMRANNTCMTQQQTDANSAVGAAGMGSGGGGGGGNGRANGNAAGQSGQGAVNGQPATTEAEPTRTTETEPGERSANNGRSDQGTTGAEPDKYVCDYMREEIKNAPDAQTKSANEQAARDYGCRL